MSDRETRIYVGNLPHDVTRRDVEDLFHKYGQIRDIDLKTRRTAFAFIEYYDARDADDAVDGRNNYNFDGYRLRVEKTRGGGPRFGGGGRGGSSYIPGRQGGPPSKRTNYRIRISGLPRSGSWQDVKDHMRECGDVCYADVFKDGTGVVEYSNKEDMKSALRKLYDTKFTSHQRESSYIRLRDDSRRSSSRSRSRSYSRKRSSSRSRSRSRRSYSRSRSRSRRDSRSRSRDSRKSRDSRSRSKDSRKRSRTRSRSRS